MMSGMGKLFRIAVNSGKAYSPQLQRGAATEPFPYLFLFVLHQTQFLPKETCDLPEGRGGLGTPAAAVIAPGIAPGFVLTVR